LEHPDFGFVKKNMKARPYERLIKRMRDYAAIEEITEGEDDVCIGYLLKGRNALWKLDLSLVGPFGIFVRLSSKVEKNDFVSPDKSDIVEFERRISGLISGGGIKLLESSDLETKVPLRLINTIENVTVYQAMFCDTPKLPWN
jgi:hypothetical protein